MIPTDEQINDFKRLYKERYGYDLTSAEAHARGMSMLRIVKFAYQPITQAEIDALEWHRNKNIKQ